MRIIAMVVFVVAIAAASRFPTLAEQSYWVDEAATVEVIDRDFDDALTEVRKSESTPPLYYVLAWSWAKLFGTGEVALRSLSAAFGTATVLIAFAAGASVAGARGGVNAAALIAVNPLLIWYSQEARAYALLVFLAALSFLFFVRALSAPTPKVLAAWSLVSCLAIATHYFGAFLVGVEALWLVGRAWPRAGSAQRAPGAIGAAPEVGERKILVVAVAAIITTCLVLLALVARQLPNAGVVSMRSLRARMVRVPVQFIVGLNVSVMQVVLGVAIGTLLLYPLVALVKRRGDSRVGYVRIAAIVGVSAVAGPACLALVGLDFLNTRNVIAALLPCAIVIAAGLAITSRPVGDLVTIVLCVLFLAVTINVDLNPRLQRTDFRGAARALGIPNGNRAIVVTLAGSEALEPYVARLHPMPVMGARVREIDLVGLTSHIGSNREVLRPAATVKPPAGFFEVQREDEETYSLIRFRSSRASRVTASDLAALGLPAPRSDTLGPHTVILLQMARPL